MSCSCLRRRELGLCGAAVLRTIPVHNGIAPHLTEDVVAALCIAVARIEEELALIG